VAKTSKGGIIIPEPGEVLLEAGASGMLGDAAAAVVQDFLNTPLRPNPFVSKIMPPINVAFDWGENEMGGSYSTTLDPEEFKKQYQAEPPAEPKGKPLIDVLFNDETPEKQEELKAANEAIFEHFLAADPKKAKAITDAINDFTRQKMKQDGYAKKLFPPIPISNHELEDFEKQAQMASKESAVDILFWYYRGTGLIYSVRRVADNFFYDFETRKFSVLPVTPRATLPKSEEIDPCGYIYATRLAGKFNDGEYVVTIRDAKADDVVVGITALFIKGGVQMETPEEGLEDTPVEEGLPVPEGAFRRRQRRIRSIDVDDTPTENLTSS
jgi:hypothetical protein